MLLSDCIHAGVFSIRLKKAAQLFIFLLSALALFLLLPASEAKARYNPKYAAIVMDAETGMILYQRHADKRLHPASLAKIMTLILTFDALERGDLGLRERIYISRRAANMSPSKLGLKVGASIRVEDAIYALVTKSANDIAVALAEKIAGSENKFSVLMNRKAQDIGMTRSYFRNASGLHNSMQVTTARDIAKLSRYLIRSYPNYYHYFATRKFTYRGKTYLNHNRLMDQYSGMDGLKTGYIRPSGFNLVATAVRDNRRLIGVVFGGRTAQSRNRHMKTLLDQSFARLKHINVAAANIPTPPRKPTQGIAIALNDIQPAAEFTIEDLDQDDENSFSRTYSLMNNPILRHLAGEGDYDPYFLKRLETGMLALSALKGKVRHNYDIINKANSPANVISDPDWAIQIGTYSNRVRTDKALKQVMHSLPGHLAEAVPLIVPLKTSHGWLFRARLSGYTQRQAMSVCRSLRECMLISPQAR